MVDIIESGYAERDKPWIEIKGEIAHSIKGYRNIVVKRVRTDTKGLFMYEVWGEKV